MPFAVRCIAAAVGVLLVLTAARSVIGTVIVPRPVTGWLTRWVDWLVGSTYHLATDLIRDHRRRDRILAGQAAAILLTQLAAWLLIFFTGFALLLWPFVPGGITTAFATAGPALFEIGSAREQGSAIRTILDIASLTGLVTITLQIAYLPTLYSAYNRRETEVSLLNARAGVPSWGPELLARTHYALGSGVSTIDTLPDLYERWERWAADVAESHTTYLPLVRFRSPRPMSSWVTALLAVLDSAALYLALSPAAAPTVPARLCLRSGFLCFSQVARAMRLNVPEEPDPAAGISVTYEEFLDAIAVMRKVDFPIERDDPKEAWPDFVGWRVNYEQAAYALAYALDVVPALWSGPRPHFRPPIPPRAHRPASQNEGLRAARPVGHPDGAEPGSSATTTSRSCTTPGSGSATTAAVSLASRWPAGAPWRPPGTRPAMRSPRWRCGRASVRPASTMPAAATAGSTASPARPAIRS